VYMPIGDIKPYKNNPRKNEAAVDYVAASIEKFGFRVPVVIDKRNVIVAGDTRYKAALKIGMTEVPCVDTEGLTAEQIRAYRIADNSVAEVAQWDKKLLGLELSDLDFDMGGLNIDFGDLFEEKPPAGYKQTTRMDNFFRTDFERGANEWGIPETEPFTGDMTGVEWMAFGEKAKIGNAANTAIHFYIDDYKFESVWSTPDKWIDLFRQCRAVVSPDWSCYTDMPKAQQLWNHYRRQWCARYWQERGVNVISSLSWANGQVHDWNFAGIPHGTTVATSFVGDNIDKQAGIGELKLVLETVKPCKIFIKANAKDAKELRRHFEFEHIPPYVFKR